jgi:hypothetical protein
MRQVFFWAVMGGALWGAYKYGCKMGERKALEKLGVPAEAAKVISEAPRQASPDAIQAVGN